MEEPRRAANGPKGIEELGESIVWRAACRVTGGDILRRRWDGKEICNRGTAGASRKWSRKRGTKLAGVVAERRVAYLVPVRCPFKRGIEHAIAHTDTGSSWRAQQFAQEAALGVWSIGETYTRGKVVPPCWRQRTRHTGAARKYPATRRARKHHRLLSWYERLNFVELFMPGSAHVIAQAVVQGQVRFHSPAVLRVQAKIKVSAIGRVRLPLYKRGWRTQ